MSVRVIDLDAACRALGAYDHLERFGGRYRVPLARIYLITRDLVVSILNDHGDIQDDRTDCELFYAVAKHHPEHATRLLRLLALHPFAVRGVEPFDPIGQDLLPDVERLRNAAIEVLGLAVQVRAGR